MLDRETILKALARLSDMLQEAGIVGEINLLGGTAMILGFQARQSTKDVDAIFVRPQEVRKMAGRMAAELSLPDHWLNDAAKAYLSRHSDFRDLAGFVLPHLRVQVPAPE